MRVDSMEALVAYVKSARETVLRGASADAEDAFQRLMLWTIEAVRAGGSFNGAYLHQRFKWLLSDTRRRNRRLVPLENATPPPANWPCGAAEARQVLEKVLQDSDGLLVARAYRDGIRETAARCGRTRNWLDQRISRFRARHRGGS